MRGNEMSKVDYLILLMAFSLFVLGIYDHKLPAIIYSTFPLLPAAVFYGKDFPPKSSKFLCLLTYASVALVNTMLLLQDTEGFVAEYLTKPFAWVIILSAVFSAMGPRHYSLKGYRGIMDLLAGYIVIYFFPFSYFGYAEGWLSEPLFIPLFLVSHLILVPPICMFLRAYSNRK
ncbi:hypothetical protein D9Q81_08575 [Candidatus Korarchaeum cryptofilum]|uniref:DUF1404 domain-containing protein n=2 Tax=Candidatus Korarchaeum cryptofilum TaxID=498846 RepID=A0A3R9PCQ8_9CREN|nr:hypothetical protein D9Q81_08575 [Candidatus Korarchaeum cryptofilum]